MSKKNIDLLLDPMENSDLDGKKDRQFVTSLARGLELLRCFSPTSPILGNADLAKKTGLPRPTITRLTHTLTRLGYLKHLPDSGKYQLDIGVLNFGYRLLNNLSIRTTVQPLMKEMANYAGAAVAIAARDRLQMVYLDVVHGEANLTMRRPIGSYVPIHVSAIGRACLAAMPERERNFIMKHLKTRYPTEWNVIRTRLEEAFSTYGTDGYCLSIGDWHRDVNAVAVPFFHQDELYVFNCGGPSFHLTEEKLRSDIGVRMLHMVSNITIAHY